MNKFCEINWGAGARGCQGESAPLRARRGGRLAKVNTPTGPSTYCLLLLIEILSRRFCRGVDFLKLINTRKQAREAAKARALQFVLESQLPHKIVNLVFKLVMVDNELTILWGS